MRLINIQQKSNMLGTLTIYSQGGATLYVQEMGEDIPPVYRMKHTDVINSPHVSIREERGELVCTLNFGDVYCGADEWVKVRSVTEDLLDLLREYKRDYLPQSVQ